MKNLKHVVTVLRPPQGNLDSRGQKIGKAEVVYKAWPCSIEQVAGSEDEIGRTLVATATYAVAGYTDPKKPINETDWLLMHDERVLEVASVLDVNMNGQVTQLACGELRED